MGRLIPPIALAFAGLALYAPFQPPLAQSCPRLVAMAGYSALPALIWIALGPLLLRPSPAARDKCPWLAAALLYALMCIPGLRPVRFILRPAFVVALIRAFLALPSRPAFDALCFRLRQWSILVFVTHFPFHRGLLFLGKTRFPVLFEGPLPFGLVLSGALLVSVVLLRWKDKPGFRWLRLGL